MIPHPIYAEVNAEDQGRVDEARSEMNDPYAEFKVWQRKPLSYTLYI